MRKKAIFILLFLLVLSGCWTRTGPEVSEPQAPGIVFTHQLRRQHRLTDEELKYLQYYAANSFTLLRIVDTKEKEFITGKLKVVDGKMIEEVEIKIYTPGVATRVYGKGVWVSYESGLSLKYGIPARDDHGDYTLLGHNKDGAFSVAYGNHRYQIKEKGGIDYNLILVDIESINNVVKNRRTAPGRTLDSP